ncbi:MAG TPA: hypothetical protein ENI05_14070 [Porticoccus sp.]|nr:hypothetical protein [Porticoccus sp.]
MAEDKKTITKIVNNSFWFEKVHNNTGSTYEEGEAIGTVQSLEVRGAGGGGIFLTINAFTYDAVAVPLRIWFFRRRPRAVADGVVIVFYPNDMKKFAAFRDIPAGLYITKGNLRLAHLANANVAFSCPDGFLYYIVECMGTGQTYKNNNTLELTFGDWPD